VSGLSGPERACLDRFCALLHERLAERLVEIRLFGSAARGDMWPAHSPMHSDVDLLVVTREPVAEDEADALCDETYPLYLECGRQLSPHFSTERRLAAPEDARTRDFLAGIAADVVPVWPRG
jgi:predicted nucleotidyltransferase